MNQDNARYSIKRGESFAGDVKPDVSIIMPIYNAEYTLEEALASARRQTYSNIEIVCVDDASTDSSMEIVGKCGDKRITIVSHHENLGCGAAMNSGIEAAKGDWIAILEPDDYILPKMIETMYGWAAMWESENIHPEIVKTPYYRMVRPEGVKRGDKPEKRLECSYRHRVFDRCGIPFSIEDNRTTHLLVHHPSIWSAIYKKAFLEEKGIRFVEYPGAGWADNEFFYKTLLSARSICYLDEPFYCYREETRGEYEAFVRKVPNQPFDRWHAMQDIVEGLECCRDIREAHIRRGFTYLSGVVDALGDGHPLVVEQQNKMFDRMDPSIVKDMFNIRPALKEAFFAYRGIEFDKGNSKAHYLAGLVGEAGYTLYNNGPGFAAESISRYLGLNDA